LQRESARWPDRRWTLWRQAVRFYDAPEPSASVTYPVPVETANSSQSNGAGHFHGTIRISRKMEFLQLERLSMTKLGVVMLVAATLTSTTVSAPARTIYDGRWSVLIITEKGTCDRAYRYPIDIRDGNVVYSGDVVDMHGRVASNGAVRVTVSRGNQSADGYGRLGREFGQGVWRGLGNGEGCSGRWEAERR
jgi:hypothetical protein